LPAAAGSAPRGGMVAEAVGAAAVGGTAAAHAVWGYNRENFKYDREMRQEQELQILEYRNKQAEQWREDVRDLIGLTEKKMDLYTVPTTIQLGMCVVLFSEGRLEPGTPQWLLRMYMLSLGGAFMYLLMAVWLAMHASVVAQSSSTRLLTQLVRLPVPSWDQIEAVRTYAASYENLGVRHMLRVPFLQRPDVPGSDLPPEARGSVAPGGGGGAAAAPDGARGRSTAWTRWRLPGARSPPRSPTA